MWYRRLYFIFGISLLFSFTFVLVEEKQIAPRTRNQEATEISLYLGTDKSIQNLFFVEYITPLMTEATFRERTLATQYHPCQHLPPNFPDILKEYAREVLRAQPNDILDWSADYFQKLALETDPLQAKQPPPDHFTPVVEDPEREMLSNKMLKVFAALDSAGSGTLYTPIVRRALMEGFQLTHEQALYVLTCPFTVTLEDDSIEYKSFAYAAVRTVQYFQQKRHNFTSREDDAATEALSSSAHATVHGMNKSDVEQNFLRIFRLLDESGTGRLSLIDFTNALRNAPYHLTKRDIRVLCVEADACGEKNDEVSYEQEIPYMYERLRLAERFTLFAEEDLIEE